MATISPLPKVLIIGGGLGGLSLAQGLKRANLPIPFHIFERDVSDNFRAQGYRIRISPDGASGLQRALPPHLWIEFETTCAEVAAGGSRLDAKTGRAADWTRPPPPGMKGAQGPPAAASGTS